MVIIAAVKKVRKNMLTVKQVAERLGVGESSIRHWRIAGSFPGAEAAEGHPRSFHARTKLARRPSNLIVVGGRGLPQGPASPSR